LRLLALDTAGDGCSAGVFADGEALSLRYRAGGPGHAELLPSMLGAVIDESGFDLAAMDALAVTVGPGSFTGIRTGLAAARGLALVSGLRGYGVTTLEALAAAVDSKPTPEPAAGPIAAVVDARRGQVYLQLFTGLAEPLGAPRACAPGEAAAELVRLGPVRLVGSGASLVAASLAAAAAGLDARLAPRLDDVRLDALAVARAAVAMAARGALPVAGFDLHPLYLRDADARADAGRSLLTARSARSARSAIAGG